MTLNAEEKAQVKAVIDRISDKPKPLTEEERAQFENAAYRVYNSIGPDSGWEEKSPSKATFFDTICDQMWGPHAELTKEQQERWSKFSTAEKKRIVFAVGP